jgi:hypothetical protein
MEFIVWVETRLGGKRLEIPEVAKVEREATGIGPEELGLTLADGKTVLKQVQERIVQIQVEAISAAAKACRNCGRNQRMKDLRSRQLRTIFGTVDVLCRRFVRCTCRGGKPRAAWPLRGMEVKRTLPELSYLLAKWGSTMPYRRAAQLLSEFLPLSDRRISPTTAWRHTLAVGEQLDRRATEPDEYDWPDSRRLPVPPAEHLTVAIDGTYVRADASGWLRQHYVVAGRIERDGRLGGHFAWVAQDPTSAREFMKAALQDHGWTEQSRVTVLADGADGLKSVVQGAVPQAPRNILDWFHISMRLRPIEQMGPNVADVLGEVDAGTAATIRIKLPRLRYQMWHGKWAAAIERMRGLFRRAGAVIESLRSLDAERVGRFRQHLVSLRDYLKNNWSSLTNYGHLHRHGRRISSAPAESGMTHLVNQRMGKCQPMCWSLEGAHLLLQVRCAMLDNRLDARFREWYPQFRQMPAPVELPIL